MTNCGLHLLIAGIGEGTEDTQASLWLEFHQFHCVGTMLIVTGQGVVLLRSKNPLMPHAADIFVPKN